MAKNRNPDQRALFGIVPAAGKASRLGRIPCSKEILPVGVIADPKAPSGLRVRAAIECALDAFREAGTEKVTIVVSPAKDDIEVFLGRGERWGLDLHYDCIANTNGAAETIDTARHLLDGADVALAFPDIQFTPRNAIRKIAELRRSLDADLTMALVRSIDGHKVDLVEMDCDDRIVAVEIKPGAHRAGWTWIAAVWTPGFTGFFHRTLEKLLHRNDNNPEGTTGIEEPAREIFVGDIIQEAIRFGLNIRGVAFDEGGALDVGTPESLSAAWSQIEPKMRGE